MIFQQPNPGVHYEYILPSENPASPQQEGKWDPHCLSPELCLIVQYIL